MIGVCKRYVLSCLHEDMKKELKFSMEAHCWNNNIISLMDMRLYYNIINI
jgi:hypothetical protein